MTAITSWVADLGRRPYPRNNSSHPPIRAQQRCRLATSLWLLLYPVTMAHPSPWDPLLLPPLEPDEFLFDVLPETQLNTTCFPLPTLSSPLPGHFHIPPEHFVEDYTAGAVFDFIDSDTAGFEDVPWAITSPFDDGGVQPPTSPFPTGLTNTTEASPFLSASYEILGNSIGLVGSEFEQKVLSILDTAQGTVSDLEIGCLDAQQEDTLTRISRERGLAIRFQPSSYPNCPRVAIIPRHESHAGPGPPVSLADGRHTPLSTASGMLTTQSNSLQTPLRSAWPTPPELPLLFSDPQHHDGAAVPTLHVTKDVPQRHNIVPKLNHIRSLKNRILGRSKSQGRSNAKGPGACYPCRLTRKKCDSGEPCQRCAESAKSPSPTACRRGPVADLTTVPVLCYLPPEGHQPSSPVPPRHPTFSDTIFDQKYLDDASQALEKAKRALDHADIRRYRDIGRIKDSGGSAEDMENRSLLVRVATTEIKDLRGYVYSKGDGQYDYDFPYNEIIQKILWELVDNPRAAEIIGVDEAEDLVALMEAASRCEAKFREWGTKKRLVYQSLRCLRDCLEAIRLLTTDLLTPSAHIYCKAPKCTCPGLAGLSERLPRYIDCLTSALLRKKRDEDDDWLMLFYSLCIQSYVRRGLIKLSESWHRQRGNINDDISSGCADYLHTAVNLFCQVSAQNKGKLAARIKQSPAQASAYVGVSSLGSLSSLPPPPPLGGTSWPSDKWREVGVEQHLRRIFDMEDANTPLHQPDDEAYDLDATITTTKGGAQAGARRNRESNGSLQQLNPSKRLQLMVSLPKRTLTPSLSSAHSMTSLGDSAANSFADTWNSSVVSFSTFNSGLGGGIRVSGMMIDDDRH
ncbi:hypothetical protein QBC34DRAFT_412275 [Podospora aff. communis PSN243]|uniref:Zn(2)-C6 fungal-type domain-containing protein n=1 Tax=Podospora aff. communis PSN243 TaxID=3040156 RepID=A0AAV9GC68_9PEZI|nr:hypothetical protein QBC34DRAFT_412275 [Podospora aff. communis PSN243]